MDDLMTPHYRTGPDYVDVHLHIRPQHLQMLYLPGMLHSLPRNLTIMTSVQIISMVSI